MSAPARETSAAVKLQCLRGGNAPPEIAADIKKVLGLPARAKQRFWQALGPSLGDPVGPELETLLDDFCRAHAVPDADLAPAIKACRFLLREAARVDLSADAFAQDLAALADDNQELRGILLAGYEAAKTLLRTELLQNTLSDHGKLLTRVDWRVDTINASNRGIRVRAPVAILTLNYTEGGQHERISLQVTPDLLQQLRAICDQILA